jgi:outer membrane protein TolC
MSPQYDVARRLPRLVFPLIGALLALLAGTASAQERDALEPFVREAIRNNLSFQQQRLTHEKSEAAVTQARGLFLPSVSLDARYSEITGGLDFGDLVNPAYQALNQITGSQQFPTNIDGRFPYAQETRVRVAQPIFQPSVISNYQIQKSLRGLEGARLRAGARALAADVQLAYVNYARAQRVVDLYTNTFELVSEAVRVNERLLENGKITPVALHRAIADRSEIEQQIAEAEQRLAAARRYFNFTLGRTPDDSVALITDSLLVRELDIPLEEALQRALRAREEIEQADWGIRASEAQERLARSSFLPAISIAVDYGVQGNEYRFDSRNDVTVASLVLSWNLFNGGQDAARRQQAAIDVDRGRIGKQEAEQQIELQVRQAYDGVVVSRKAIHAAQDRVNAARRSFELMRRRHTEGVASQLEFVDARTALTSAELNWILTRHQYVANYIELERVAALRTLDLSEAERKQP